MVFGCKATWLAFALLLGCATSSSSASRGTGVGRREAQSLLESLRDRRLEVVQAKPDQHIDRGSDLDLTSLVGVSTSCTTCPTRVSAVEPCSSSDSMPAVSVTYRLGADESRRRPTRRCSGPSGQMIRSIATGAAQRAVAAADRRRGPPDRSHVPRRRALRPHLLLPVVLRSPGSFGVCR